MSALPPVMQLAVGVVVERRKAKSPWIDFVWKPVAVLPGVPEVAPWTVLAAQDDWANIYVGAAQVALYRSETGMYRDNLATGEPLLWVVLAPTESNPPYELHTVTADPSEGEALTEAGSNIVESVAMPDAIRELVEAFVAQHHVERVFFKRQRDKGGSGASTPRGPTGGKDRSQ